MNTQRIFQEPIQHFFRNSKKQLLSVYEGELEDLESSQLYCIYHHLSKGMTVSLKRVYQTSEVRIAVLFKGFLIGYIPSACTDVVSQLLEREFLLSTSIVNVVRKKYLSPTSISIRINA